MKENSQTRNVPALAMRAEFAPSSVNEDARTVDIIWTTGARVKRSSWWDGDFFEELSLDPAHVRMARLESGKAPFLADHNGRTIDAVIGVISSARLENGRGVATVRFAKEDAAADAAWNKLRQGILPNVSVGYRIHKFEKVEGGDDTTPVFRATDWEPHEVSLVAIPADAAATVRSADVSPTNPCQFITRGVAPHKEKYMDEEKKTPAPVQTDAERSAQLQAEREAATKTERERVAGIRLAVRATQLGDETAEKLINDGTPLDKARALLLEEAVKRSNATPVDSHVRIEVGETGKEKFLRGAEAWLIQRAGKSDLVQAAVKAGKAAAVATDPGEFRGLTLIGLARESLERSGVSTRRMSDERIADLALTRRGGGLATAGDFPILLENVTNKILLGAYEVAPNEWSRFCKRGSVANFHAHNRYRPGAFGTLDSVNDHGELKNKAIPDGEKRSVTIGTYGNTIGISRKTLIQDDMGVFTDLASAFGLAAQNTIEAAVWTKVKANSGLGTDYGDGNPLFHTSRANINATGSALSVAGLDADRVIMKRQAAPSGTTTLNLAPSILVVPAELGMLARTLNSDAFDPDGTNPKFQKSNGVRGMFRDIVDSAQITGTRRYLFADPAVAPVYEVTFLQGQEAPQMEQQDGFEVLGLQWRVFLDFGVNLVDYRGCVTNAGA